MTFLSCDRTDQKNDCAEISGLFQRSSYFLLVELK